ncbi:MAG: hypothetical protein AVDCRST_MAG85-4209, partial [uncultured Solirubrobacteraceae bacterium]
MVVSIVALIVALGGTSYAAFKLPRNSVGAPEIKTGAVRGSEVKNGSLGVRDLSRRTRAALRGPAGAAGVPGAAGARGATGASGPAGPTG